MNTGNAIKQSFTLQNLEIMIEIIMLSLFPYPFWDTFIFEMYWTEDGALPLSRFISDYLFLCMLLRWTLFYRCYNLYSIYADAFCQKLCYQVGADFNISFVSKCRGQNQPLARAITTIVLSAYLYATCIRIFEKPLIRHREINSDNHGDYVGDYFDTFYLAIITITTVGYGDLTCQSLFGRWTCCVAALHGAFIVSYFVATGSSRLDLSQAEAQVAFQIQSSNRSIDTIKRMFKFFIVKKQFYIHMLALDENLYQHPTPFLETYGNMFEMKKAANKLRRENEPN